MLAENWTQIGTQIGQQFLAQSGWEMLAVALGLAYVILAARESIWCWPAAFASTAIFTLLFWQGMLPMQAVLNLFYLAMAVYGFMLWRRHEKPQQNVQIHVWPWRYHLFFVLIGTFFTFAVGGLLTLFEASQKPYLDAFVMVFSILNTFLMARKVLENWLYWLVIDAAAMVLYWQTGYLLTALMMALYLGLAIYGLFNWLKLYRHQQSDDLLAPRLKS